LKSECETVLKLFFMTPIYSNLSTMPTTKKGDIALLLEEKLSSTWLGGFHVN
jgi:hypothetical protein